MQHKYKGKEYRSALEACGDWLQDALASEPIHLYDLLREGKSLGFSQSQIYVAKKGLPIKRIREGNHLMWYIATN